MLRKLSILLWSTFLIVLAGCAYAEASPKAKLQATNWQKVYGAVYFASYARNPAELWSRFDPEIIDRELGYAQKLGLNSIRVWLDSRPYEDDPALMLSQFEKFLQLCAKHKLTVMPVLFDSCGAEQEDLKKRGLSVDPHWKQLTPNPGYRYLGPEHWARLETYVKAIVGGHLNDPRILAWDVMNEPWAEKIWKDPQKRLVATKFVRHFCEVVSSMKPAAPITVGVTFLKRAEVVDDLVGVITFHRYIGPNSKKWEAHLAEAKQYAELKGKPILLTEWGFPTWGAQRSAGRIITDGEQLKFYQEVMPVVMRSNMGWYIVELMMGYGPIGGRMGVVKPNGELRPAGVVIQKLQNK